jgi:PIN domain nuclease of toxin-antitoxin system
MKLLLDTHIALWAVSDDPRLSPQARELIAAPAQPRLGERSQHLGNCHQA